MSKRRDLLERLSEDDPNYEVARRFYLEAWADSNGLLAEALAGRVSLAHYVEANVKTFSQGAELHVALVGATPRPARRREIDWAAKKFILIFSDALSSESERLGEANVRHAVDELSRQVNEIAARSKQQILKNELARGTGPQPNPIASPPATGYRSTRVIDLCRGSDRVAQVKVPKMAYVFPADFPFAARQRFLAKRLRAERALETKKNSIQDFVSAEALLIDFVLRVFIAFAEEAHKLGMQGVLTPADVEEECLSFLRTYTLQAGLLDGHVLTSATLAQGANSVYTRIEDSKQWKEYRRLLQQVADAQIADGSDTSIQSGTAANEPVDMSSLVGEDWIPHHRPDWREDATFARENHGFLRPVKAARLEAMATLQKDAATAVQSTLPPTKEQLEICLWPAFSKYAEVVFDRLADAELIAAGPGHQSAYSLWLRKKCLPAVVDDVCGGFFGQFPITLRYVIETLGQKQSPEIDETRRALWGIGILGSPFTESLRNSLNAHLEGRSTHWEAIAISRKPAPAATDADQFDPCTIVPASDEQFASLSDRDTAIHNLVGEHNFRTLTNAEIMRVPGLKKKLRDLHQLRPEDPAKSCFDRIRKAKAYPLSREVQKKRLGEPMATVRNGRKSSHT
jgi:hypothetical protein